MFRTTNKILDKILGYETNQRRTALDLRQVRQGKVARSPPATSVLGEPQVVH